MIRALVNFALNNRLLILAAAVLLTAWGIVAFHNLPVEAYPDIAPNYVEVITQWPGRAAEEVEQQVTIPIEIAVNGIPHLEHLRSISLFGLSNLILIFDDDSVNDWNRQKVVELPCHKPGNVPDGLEKPEIGADYSPSWRDLQLHAPEYKSAIRPDGSEIAQRLGAPEALLVGAERGRPIRLRRTD